MITRYRSGSKFVGVAFTAAAVLLCVFLLAACAPAATPAPEQQAPAAATEESAPPPEEAEEGEPPIVDTSVESEFCIDDDQAGKLVVRDCNSPADMPDTAKRDDACADIVPFDGEEAFAAVADLPIGWTFGVNFDAISSADAPFGCLRIYQRDPNAASGNGAYVAVDGGGIVVDTCTVAAAPSAGPLPVFGGGTASFCRAGVVTCTLAIGPWINDPRVQQYVLANAPASAPSSLAGELMAFAPPGQELHTYVDFSMVADVAWPEDSCVLDEEQPLPIVRYIPDTGMGSTYELDLASKGGNAITVPNVLTCSPSATWDAPPEGMRLWRFHDATALTAPEHPLFVYQAQGGQAGYCTVTGPLAPVELWVGNSTLMIGHDTNTPDIGFTGAIGGVLIDPFDSKPPTSIIKG